MLLFIVIKVLNTTVDVVVTLDLLFMRYGEISMEDDSVIATGISGVHGHRLEAGEARLAKKMKQDQS